MAVRQLLARQCLLNSTLRNDTKSPALLKVRQPQMSLEASEMTHARALGPRSMKPCPVPQRQCPPPPPCPWPQSHKQTKANTVEQVLRALWFLTRLGIFLGIAKFTVDEGLWGDSKDTQELAKRMGIVLDEDTSSQEKTQEVPKEKQPRGWWNNLLLRSGEFFELDP